MTIRRTPQDFLVDELLSDDFARAITPEARSPGDHVVYRLTKESRTTPESVSALARALGVPSDHVAYAGLKDKHARTTQFISVPSRSLSGVAASARPLAGWGGDGAFVGYSPEPISSEAITGNRFRLMVRGLDRKGSDEMDRRAALLTPAGESSLLVLNYFGDQRFGSARHGRGWVATRLLEGDFENALRLAIGTPSRHDVGQTKRFHQLASTQWGRWEQLARSLPRVPERRAIEVLARGGSFEEAFGALPAFLQALYVEAHQSHLWNEIARRLARRMLAEAGAGLSPIEKRARDGTTRLVPAAGPGMLVTPGLFGEMHFPPARAVGEVWREIDLPTLAPSTTLDPLWRGEAESVLADEGLTLKGLRIPRVRRPFYGAAMRPLFVRAANVTLSPMEPDDLARPARARKRDSQEFKRAIGFDLPRGAYATVVLRALGQ